uniref:RNA-directed DNA polymerase n=1 Tax=Photinus pyralis TaxID=7054 RepID=A0A1Y1NGJ5_PHOPY
MQPSKFSILKFGKRQKESVLGRTLLPYSDSAASKISHFIKSKDKIILDYIIAQGNKNECPYININILGKTFLGLLDSGANKTLINEYTWNILQSLNCKLDASRSTICTVANNDQCQCLGVVTVPVTLQNVTKLIEFYVIPELRQSVILGIDFWAKMGIIADISRGEWYFSSKEEHSVQIKHIESQSDLSTVQQVRLDAIVQDYFNTFKENELGCTSIVKHKIITNSPPIKQRYYPVSPYKQKLIDAELDKMLEQGVIEKSCSAWSSPVLLVPKKDGSQRFCVDFRQLNQVSERDAYPLPFMSSILSKLGSTKYISSLDIKSAYWQVALDEESKQYTAFTVPGRGLYQFTRLPYGLHNAPATFQRLVDVVLGPDLEPFVFCYLDDIIIVTPNFEKHLTVLSEVLHRLRNAGLSLNKEKSKFCRPELKYLGYVVNHSGLHVDLDKVQCIINLPKPVNLADVRRLLGMVSWYRRFIPSHSDLVAPLTNLLKKDVTFQWDAPCEESLGKIKEALISAPILTIPNFEKPFILQTDASNVGIGAVLTQIYDDQEHVICYLSRALTRTERKFSVTERECLAVLWSVEKLRCYLDGVKFTVITDHHSLVWLNNLKDPQGRLGRWVLRLQQFDYDIVHRKGLDHVVPDFLSRAINPNDEGVELHLVEVSDVHDPWYLKMIDKINHYPLQYTKWRVVDNKIYKRMEANFKELRDPSDCWKLVLPRELRKEAIHSCHDVPLSGHLGIYKTFSRVSRFYYWPSMRNDIIRYIKSCKTCQSTKPEQKAPAGHMGNALIPDKPWQIISFDLVGPLPRTSRGYQFIFVVTDIFSKFNLFFPLRRAIATQIVKILEDSVFLLFGVPQFCRCDNGVQFRSKEFEKLCQKYNVKVIYTPNYHPQPNNTERVNRVLKTMISSYVDKEHRKWDEHLSALACALRTARHETTLHTPYFINFGRDMFLDGKEYQRVPQELVSENTDDDLGDRNKVLHSMRKLVKENLVNAYSKSSQHYNLRRRDVSYEVNDLVWKRNYAISDAANYVTKKLSKRFEGPFRVKKKVGYCTYELEDELGNTKGLWHVVDLKPYKS